MSAQTSSNPRSEILDLDKFPSYVLQNQKGIAQLILSLEQKHCLLNVYLPGDISFVSAILSVANDGTTLLLDRSPDERLNACATWADSLTCVTHLDGVLVQFSVGTPVRFPFDGFEALSCPMPHRLLRLQRREFYRLPVPISHPAICKIFSTDGRGGHKTADLRIVDISSGGLAFQVNPNQIDIRPAMVFDQCLLMIPDFEPANVKLQVRNQLVHESRSGAKQLRIGCQFVDLPAKVATMIQRYIFHVERERRLLEAG